MDPLFSTLVLMLVALLGARISFSTERAPAGPRLLFRTGTHFLFVGFALGPGGLGLLTPQATQELSALLALGLGWVGFHFGLQLEVASLARFSWRHHALAIGQAVLTFLLFFAGAYALALAFGLTGSLPLLLVLAAACTAAISTPAGVAMVSSNFLVKGPVRDLLFFVASIDALVSIASLQLIYAIFPHEEVAAGMIGGLEAWLVIIALGLGLACGIVFLWLVRGRPAGEELVLFLLGLCAFTAGVALQWGLSPLFVSVTAGAVVANFGKVAQRARRLQERWEKPVYVTLLLLGGALIQIPTMWVLPMAVGYALLRFAAKVAGTSAMVSAIRFPFEVPRRLGLGLVPQGGISLAMAISVVLVYPGLQVRGVDAEAIFFTVVILGVMLSELIGPFLTLRVLRRAGEIPHEVEEAIAEGDERRAEREAIRHTSGGGNGAGTQQR